MADEIEEPGNTPESTAETKDYQSLSQFASETEASEYQPGTATEPEPELGAAELAFLFDMTFSLMAARRGDHWKLHGDESKALGEATDKVLAKYLPDVKAGPEVVLLLTAGAIVAPRLMEDGKKAPAKPEPDTEEGKPDGD